MSLRDRTTLFALVRSVDPRICVETGVSGGCSSTYILEALKRGHGERLHSIDVGGPHEARYGELIPRELRGQWELHIQRGDPMLPALLSELVTLDFFLHDSDHRVRHMTWEYETAWPSLAEGGCLASHDVVHTTAFEDFRTRHASEIRAAGVVGNLGFLIKGKAEPPEQTA